MDGPLALVGGAEFQPSCEEMDRTLLARGSTNPARVLILPTAAAPERPEMAAANGVAHFRRLGAKAAPLMVVDRASANDQNLAGQVEKTSLIYLAGGDPSFLLETLQNSLVWQAILEVHQGGAVLAGSSAGAMVLAEWMRGRQRGWVKALALASPIAVLPHHEQATPQRLRTARAGLDEDTILMGIDGATACVTEEKGRWDVLGTGTVTLYFPSGTATYMEGESFLL